MNERIKELAEQAVIAVDDPFPGNPLNAELEKMYIPDCFAEKFAELIVRECVKEIEFQYGGGSDQPMDNEWDRAIEYVSSMVKYRFGVEE